MYIFIFKFSCLKNCTILFKTNKQTDKIGLDRDLEVLSDFNIRPKVKSVTADDEFPHEIILSFENMGQTYAIEYVKVPQGHQLHPVSSDDVYIYNHETKQASLHPKQSDSVITKICIFNLKNIVSTLMSLI